MTDQSLKSLSDIDMSSEELCKLKTNYKYQRDNTKTLQQHTGDYDQAFINRIVLWKVNRYSGVSEQLLDWINATKQHEELNEALTRKILRAFLDPNLLGFQLAMASTVLRFRNPRIYQIIDQRAYRVVYKRKFDLSGPKEEQIDLYLAYLKKLREVSDERGFPFEDADEILYELDKRVNKGIKLR